jgi:antitoxin component HigA of HigAB toxin-antitoxin module
MDKNAEDYLRALDMVNKIYDTFDEAEASVDEALTVLIMTLLNIAEEQGIPTSRLITGIRKQIELQEALQNPHSTVQ